MAVTVLMAVKVMMDEKKDLLSHVHLRSSVKGERGMDGGRWKGEQSDQSPRRRKRKDGPIASKA